MSGLFGSSKAAGGPRFDEAKARQSQIETIQRGQFGVESSLGGLGTKVNPDGTVSRVFDESQADIQRGGLIGQGLEGLSLDPSRAEDAFVSRSNRLLDPRFEQQSADLERNLANRGISMDSEQGRRLTEDLRRSQGSQRADIADRAISSGQGLAGQQIANIGALAGQRDILSLPGLGGATGAQDLFAQKFQADKDRQDRINQFKAQRGSAIGSLIGGGLALSDKRLKENLKAVGRLDNGLAIYIGNYNDKAIELDSTLNKTPQLFLIAQEVQETNPEAVIEKDGYLMVNYKEAINGK